MSQGLTHYDDILGESEQHSWLEGQNLNGDRLLTSLITVSMYLQHENFCNMLILHLQLVHYITSHFFPI